MKIKFTLDLEENDVIEEVFDDDDYTSHYELKSNDEIEALILEQLRNEIVSSIKYDNITNKVLGKLVKENKEAIIEAIVTRVSKSIINNKAMKDFKKSLEVE